MASRRLYTSRVRPMTAHVHRFATKKPPRRNRSCPTEACSSRQPDRAKPITAASPQSPGTTHSRTDSGAKKRTPGKPAALVVNQLMRGIIRSACTALSRPTRAPHRVLPATGGELHDPGVPGLFVVGLPHGHRPRRVLPRRARDPALRRRRVLSGAEPSGVLLRHLRRSIRGDRDAGRNANPRDVRVVPASDSPRGLERQDTVHGWTHRRVSLDFQDQRRLDRSSTRADQGPQAAEAIEGEVVQD